MHYGWCRNEITFQPLSARTCLDLFFLIIITKEHYLIHWVPRHHTLTSRPIKSSRFFSKPHGAMPMVTILRFALKLPPSLNAAATCLTTPAFNPDVIIQAPVVFAAFNKPSKHWFQFQKITHFQNSNQFVTFPKNPGQFLLKIKIRNSTMNWNDQFGSFNSPYFFKKLQNMLRITVKTQTNILQKEIKF